MGGQQQPPPPPPAKWSSMLSNEQLSLELHQVEREIGKRTRELTMVSPDCFDGAEWEKNMVHAIADLFLKVPPPILIYPPFTRKG